MALLTSADYPAIRAAIDLTIDEKVLPPETIELPIYLGAAEREISVRDPLYLTRVGDEKRRIKNACILICAALIAPSVPWYRRESMGDYSYTRMDFDVTALINRLRALADSEILAVVEGASLFVPLTFTVASGTRGR